MRIEKGHLPAIQDCDKFCEQFTAYAVHVLRSCRLHPVASKPRLIEAHGAWTHDLHRVGAHEPQLDDGLDHFKQCGHLAFWLRRMSPIVEAIDVTQNLADAEGYPLTDDEQAFRRLLLGYCNEYLAFDYSFQICKYYELDAGSERAKTMQPSRDFYQSTCQFLKYKNVSPHAMHLIYKSLFHT